MNNLEVKRNLLMMVPSSNEVREIGKKIEYAVSAFLQIKMKKIQLKILVGIIFC